MSTRDTAPPSQTDAPRPPCWRGLQGTPAPVQVDEASQRRYIAELAEQGSNPERPHFTHAISLLVTGEQVAEQLLGRREALRRDLSPMGWARCRECFLNKRDYPLQLPTDSTPVLSQYVLQEGDLAMPALEDYARCWPGCYLGRSHAPEAALPEPPRWECRWGAAVFRGGATGAGVTPETNPRLRLVQLAHAWRRGATGRRGAPWLLDAELTSWNLRQKIGPDGVIRLLDIQAMRGAGIESCGRQHYLSWAQQAQYKYAVYLPGNVGAGRLGALLGLGFVVLALEPTGPALGLWSRMREGEHYIRLEPDLGNLRETLLRLRGNDEAARRLSEAAQALWLQELSRGALEASLAATLKSIPPPDDARLMRSLEHVWATCRAAVYALLDGEGRVLLFVPFANEDFRNGWLRPPPTDPAPLGAFLRLVRGHTRETGHLEWKRWWCNGGLVCNVMPPEVWGESMLPVLQLLLEKSACALGTGLPRIPE